MFIEYTILNFLSTTNTFYEINTNSSIKRKFLCWLPSQLILLSSLHRKGEEDLWVAKTNQWTINPVEDEVVEEEVAEKVV